MKHLRLLVALAVLAASLGIIAAPAFAQQTAEGFSPAGRVC